jgi:2,4-dienoyl-CoA reductase-like NADH-dependent reductase (Old Yellow Enzyme family)
MSSPLFSPFNLRQLTLANRIVIAPMCQYSAQDGNVGDWHLMHLGHLSHSGAGMLIVEATAVEAEGRITPDCPGLWNDANEAAFARVLKAVRRYSSMPVAIQLAHAGRKASCAVPWHGGKQLPEQAGGMGNGRTVRHSVQRIRSRPACTGQDRSAADTRRLRAGRAPCRSAWN